MHEQPSTLELAEALVAYLENEVVPKAEGGKRFRALVAANAARILAREIELRPTLIDEECERLWKLLGRPGQVPDSADRTTFTRELNRELCDRIAAGSADAGPWRAEVMDHLRATIRADLKVDNPKFSGLAD